MYVFVHTRPFHIYIYKPIYIFISIYIYADIYIPIHTNTHTHIYVNKFLTILSGYCKQIDNPNHKLVNNMGKHQS